MKFGVNTFVWVSPCTTQAVVELAPHVKELGFDILEIAVENPALIDVSQIGQAISDIGLRVMVLAMSISFIQEIY